MTLQTSPYDAFSRLLQTSPHAVTPAELQGHLLGRSCAGAGFDPEPWLAEATELLGGELDAPVRQALVGLQEMAKGELAGEDVALVLLLPTDETPITVRAQALGQWCQGFLTGFGLAAGDRSLSGEAREVLQDLATIAQVQSALEESEDAESDYMEVMEYLRVAPMLLFAECAPPIAPAAKPSLH